jgi:hypothetical protein
MTTTDGHLLEDANSVAESGTNKARCSDCKEVLTYDRSATDLYTKCRDRSRVLRKGHFEFMVHSKGSAFDERSGCAFA